MNKYLKRKIKVRKKILGSSTRPRLTVYRSLNNLYAQLIDDEQRITLASASSLKTEGSLLTKAELVAQAISQNAKDKGLTKVVFDRGGFRYLGAIKKLAESARKNGLEF